MPDIFFLSDTHFYHHNILKFTKPDGGLIRPGFTDVYHMHEVMIERWNSVVKPGDKVYHLGDVSIKYGTDLAKIMARLNGKKRLIFGNHDKIKGTNLMDFFEKGTMWRVFGIEGFVCSHVPLHPSNFPHSCVLNVHGHIHEKDQNDPRYNNISVERINHTPIHIDVLIAMAKKLREDPPPRTLSAKLTYTGRAQPLNYEDYD